MLLNAWKSAYCYTVRRGSRGVRCVRGDGSSPSVGRLFSVEWSRRPSPHEPLPDVRVLMEVALFLPASPSAPPLYRLEYELTTHSCEDHADGCGRPRDVDAQLLRLIKAKAEVYKRSSAVQPPLSAQHAHFLNSRLCYAPYAPPVTPVPAADNSGDAFPQPRWSAAVQWSALTAALPRRTSGGTAEPPAATFERPWAPATWQWQTDAAGDDDDGGGCWADEEQPPLRSARDVGGRSDDEAAAVAPHSASGSATKSVGDTDAVSAPLTSPSASSTSSSSPAATAAYAVVPTAAALEARLVELFRQADVDGRSEDNAPRTVHCSRSGLRRLALLSCPALLLCCAVLCCGLLRCGGSGRLSVEEVTALLSGAELGLSLSAASLSSFVVGLMSAYDENDDGQLVWAEFLPVAVDLIQTAQAARLARQRMAAQREDAQQRLRQRVEQRTQEQWTVDVAQRTAAYDPQGSGLLPPDTFRRLTRELPCDLSGQQRGRRAGEAEPWRSAVPALSHRSAPLARALCALRCCACTDAECAALLEQMERNGSQCSAPAADARLCSASPPPALTAAPGAAA